MMQTMTIRWELVPEDIHRVMYFIDDSPVGENDEGFNKILETIRMYSNIKVTLKIQSISSLGGHSLKESLPFRERFDELRKILGENKLVYDFI